jgi:hypothetical protein
MWLSGISIRALRSYVPGVSSYMRPRRARVGVFASAGALGVLRGAIGYRHPAYWAPTTILDWTAVLTFTAFLLAVACALLVLVAEHRGATRLCFALAAFGSALAGVANALEDGAGVPVGGYAFAAGILFMAAGLLVAGILGARPSSRPRWFGPLLLANVAVLAVWFDTAGLAFFGTTWILLAAWCACRRSQLHDRGQALRV